MLLCIRLTEKIEYELPIDLGTTGVIKVGLLTETQISVTSIGKNVIPYLLPVTFDVVKGRLYDLWEINV